MEHEDDNEPKPEQSEDNEKRIQKLMWQMKQEGAVFQSASDIDAIDPTPQSRTMFRSSSRFGR